VTTHAITRRPGPDAARGLTSAGLGEPDWGLLLRQHGDYVEHLKRLGLEVIELDALQAHPDAYFVEDPAIVAPGFAVITIPGAPSRRGEQASLEKVLKAYREIEHITPPGTVDGGDVLMAGSHFFVGVSARTNAEGARQLGAILERRGHSWTAVTVKSGLHLKSDVNSLGHDTLLLTPAFETRPEFQAYAKIVVPEQEAYAANSLLVNERLFVPRGFPETLNILQGAGYDVTELDMSEVQKMDGGLTCLSLRFTQ
jgi:dimethylargininase